MTDASGFEWSEALIDKVYLKVLYQIANQLSDYDVSFIEKLDSEEGSEEKIYKYLHEKKLNLEQIIKKEIELARARNSY